ncbi:MAG: AbrB family transcriptional regulator [Hyphomicrobiaceae bacterium]
MHIIITVLIGAAGGLLAHVSGFPAGLLSGAMAAVAVAALAGVPVVAPDWLRRVAFIVMGATLGASVSQETLASLPTWPVSLLGLAVSVVILMVVAPWFLMTVYRLDRKTAVMASVPGAFSFVMAFADDIGADVRRVAILQTLRVGALFVVVPAVIGLTGAGGFAVQPRGADLALPLLAVLLVAAFAGGLVAARLRFGAPEFVGAMLVGVILSGGGVIEGSVPVWLSWPAFIGTGVVIGTRFAGIDRAFLRESVIAGLALFFVSAAITAAAAFVVAAGLSQPFGKIWLAYAPGGLDTMAVLAFSLGYDPAFVAGHQLLRFLGLSMVLPLVLRRTLAG